MRIAEVMTQGVVTAESGDSLQHVGELMRDRNVGSVVICDDGRPVGVITDRDLALAVVADRIEPGSPAGDHASRPIVTGEVEMDLEEAVAIMIQHRIRRLPVTQGEGLVGHRDDRRPGRARRRPASGAADHRRGGEGRAARVLLPPARGLTMAQMTPGQLRTRQRVEGLIRLMSPALDVVLAVGERVSRIVEREDVEYYPPRVTRESAPPPKRP